MLDCSSGNYTHAYTYVGVYVQTLLGTPCGMSRLIFILLHKLLFASIIIEIVRGVEWSECTDFMGNEHAHLHICVHICWHLRVHWHVKKTIEACVNKHIHFPVSLLI